MWQPSAKRLDELDSGRLANVVGLSFEGEAEDGEALAAKSPERGAHLGEEAVPLVR